MGLKSRQTNLRVGGWVFWMAEVWLPADSPDPEAIVRVGQVLELDASGNPCVDVYDPFPNEPGRVTLEKNQYRVLIA